MPDKLPAKESPNRLLSPFVSIQIALVVFAFALLVFLSSWFMDDIENKHLSNGMESALNDTEINITADLKELETLLHYISETVRIMIADGCDFDTVAKYITEVTAYIMTTDERLKECTTGVYAVFDVFDGRFHDGTGWIPPDDYMPEDRPWYKAAVLANGKIDVTEPYLSMAFPGTHTLTFTRRIFSEGDQGRQGEPLGVVCLDVQMERVRGFSSNSYFAESGYGFLLNRQYEVLAHPDSTMWGKPLHGIKDHYIPLVDDLKQGIPVIQRKVNNYKDEPTFVSFRQLENGWHIGMVISENAYFKEMKRMRLIFIVLGIVLAVLFITIILRLSVVRRELQTVKNEIALTSREQEIFALLLSGKEAKEIASEMDISQSGVYYHIQNIYKKFGIQNRTELLARLKVSK